MKKHKPKPKMKVIAGSKPQEPGYPYKVLGLDEIMAMEPEDDVTFSLMVITAAYAAAMSEFTGGLDSEESYNLLQDCAINIASGHRMIVK